MVPSAFLRVGEVWKPRGIEISLVTSLAHREDHHVELETKLSPSSAYNDQ